MIGDVVLSLAGRDAGKVFLIISSVDENFVNIADGKLHKVEKPKKKKLKHIKTVKQNAVENVASLTDSAIRKILSAERAEKGEE